MLIVLGRGIRGPALTIGVQPSEVADRSRVHSPAIRAHNTVHAGGFFSQVSSTGKAGHIHVVNPVRHFVHGHGHGRQGNSDHR